MVGCERRIFSATVCVSAVQTSRSSKVVDFGINRKGVFLGELFIAKTAGVLGLSLDEDFVILASIVLTPFSHRQTYGRTVGQTDKPTVANTGLCIANYADAL